MLISREVYEWRELFVNFFISLDDSTWLSRCCFYSVYNLGSVFWIWEASEQSSDVNNRKRIIT